MLDFYRNTMKQAVIVQFQYRFANYMYMIGMIAEPLIYLVVWTTIANASGGTVSGYTTGQFAAYYIVWTLVRNMNIVFTPYGWEWRIKQGELAAGLLRPVHPLHYDIAYFAGWKIVVIVLWLPIAALLTLIFQPELNPTWLEIGIFSLAIWGAYLLRTMLLWALGMISFWTTRVGAIFQLYFAIELLFSGRIAPLSILPTWAQQIAQWLPFQWAFGFPIDALVGNLSTTQLLTGLVMQLAWIVIGLGLVALIWRAGVKQFTSVGG